MTKKLTYQGSFKGNLLADQLQAALNWSPVTEEKTARLFSRDNEVEIHADDDTEESVIAAIVVAHDPDVLTQGEIISRDFDKAVEDFKSYPDWATWTPDQAEQHVVDNVINGFDKIELDAWIDSNVTDLTSAITALKLIGGAIVDLRSIVSKIAKMVMWIRDVVIKVR